MMGSILNAGLSALGGLNSNSSNKALEASEAAMKKMEDTAAKTTAMNAQAQSTKMMTDTINGISSAYQDSATKAQNAAQQSGKSINY